MKICIYCNKEKEDKEFNREHVIPQAIGGGSETNNPLIIKVCKKCNSIAGFFIDTPFSKYWFLATSNIASLRKVVNFQLIESFQFTYMGFVKDYNLDDMICEKWIGPNRDSVFHFHPPFPILEDTESVGGLHPTLKSNTKINHGFSILVLNSNTPEWVKLIKNSYKKQFKLCDNYIVEFQESKIKKLPNDFPKDKERFIQRLQAITTETIETEFAISFGTAERFLAKTALAIGNLFLNKTFINSNYADSLRSFLWTKEYDKRKGMEQKIHGFIGNKNKFETLTPILSWGNCHIIGLLKFKDSIELFVNFYSDNPAMIRVSESMEDWQQINKNSEIIYICHPVMKKTIGPFSLEDLINHKNKTQLNLKLLEFEDLENRLLFLSPPFHKEE